MNLFAITLFLSAFLVFQVQPIFAKIILPWFGSSPSVWSLCLVFFQTSLLLGYAYAHVLTQRIKLSQQPWIHLALIACSFVWLPITPTVGKIQALPQIEIITLLLKHLSFPFILLTATAPLLQSWYAQLYPKRSPYRLYALSNLGSLIALLSYPFLIEPYLTLTLQTWYWSALYVLYALITLNTAWPILRRPTLYSSKRVSATTPSPLSKQDRLLWLALPACSSALLIAITNQIAQDISVVPLLWIIPLSLYLLSFIVCFERDSYYQRSIWLPVTCAAIMLFLFTLNKSYTNLVTLSSILVIYCGTLFACCMVCHGELVRRKPKTANLTLFYLYLALGGVLGGLFTNLLAPLLFTHYWELYLVLLTLILLTELCFLWEKENISSISPSSAMITKNQSLLLSIIMMLAIGIAFIQNIKTLHQNSLLHTRNFFGTLGVKQTQHALQLYHGRIIHGTQSLNSAKKNIPSSYYNPYSGIGLAMRHYPRKQQLINHTYKKTKPLKVGILGLGTGTLAAYGKPQDSYHFYELNPQVVSLAKKYFSYLLDSKANINITLGDGRRLLTEELKTHGSQNFDILVMDAFSGDSIPMHLLTLEAAKLYWSHLKPTGVLAIHISNLYVNLESVIPQLALNTHKTIFISQKGGTDHSTNEWALITSNQHVLQNAEIQQLQKNSKARKLVNWTDDYSSLWAVLRH